jgi:hypothetical protein
MRLALRFLRLAPVALERAQLRWALLEIDPMHEDVAYILNRLHELKGRP